MTQCWKCGDMDAEFQKKCDVPACGMKEQKEQRTWVGLTVDEVWQSDELMALNAQLGCSLDLLMEVVEAIEAKLKEKNT